MEETNAEAPERRRSWMGALTRDDKMKLMFDHIRNLGICALVGAAALFKWEHAPEAGPYGQYFDYFIAVLAACAAVMLYWANQAYLWRKLKEQGVREKTLVLWSQVYIWIAVSIVLSLLGGH